MVERPIKKSERDFKAGTDSDLENSDSVPPIESNSKSLKQNDERSKGKGKIASFGDESRQSVSPALARGPKPVKPKANVKTKPETKSEFTSEESQD